MPGEMHELLRRGGERGGSNGDTLEFAAFGVEDFDGLEQLVIDNSPATFNGLDRLSWSYAEQGPGVFTVSVKYGTATADNPALGETPSSEAPTPTPQPDFGGVGDPGEPQPTPPEEMPSQNADESEHVGPELAFHIQSGTAKIMQSLATVSAVKRWSDVGPPPPAPDFKRAICVTKDGVEGTEIATAELRFSYTARFKFMSWGFVRTLRDMACTVNDAPFFGHAAGEVRLAGITSQYHQGSARPWGLTYEFVVVKNREDVEICEGLTVDKYGHDFLWCTYKDTATNGKVGAEPDAAYTEMVYYPADFSRLGI